VKDDLTAVESSTWPRWSRKIVGDAGTSGHDGLLAQLR